ncbi:MAG: hypothetical protein QOF52_657, partial [Propionibacteriaceae bacterium]|nr:hypothetical protein [Propionibacteriaceae bacterium]
MGSAAASPFALEEAVADGSAGAEAEALAEGSADGADWVGPADGVTAVGGGAVGPGSADSVGAAVVACSVGVGSGLDGGE